MIRALDRWGRLPMAQSPAVAGPARTSCAMVRLLTRPHGAALEAELRRAVTGEVALDCALAALDALAPVDRQRVLASYAGLSANKASDRMPKAAP